MAIKFSILVLASLILSIHSRALPENSEEGEHICFFILIEHVYKVQFLQNKKGDLFEGDIAGVEV